MIKQLNQFVGYVHGLDTGSSKITLADDRDQISLFGDIGQSVFDMFQKVVDWDF